MGYKTDGSSHSDGINNEENLIEQLRDGAAKKLYPSLSEEFKVIKRGGTKFKQDMEIVDGDETILVSAKKKTEISKGSFDWVNSSAAAKSIPTSAGTSSRKVFNIVSASGPSNNTSKMTTNSLFSNQSMIACGSRTLSTND